VDKEEKTGSKTLKEHEYDSVECTQLAQTGILKETVAKKNKKTDL
jgi:hypothetical protein